MVVILPSSGAPERRHGQWVKDQNGSSPGQRLHRASIQGSSRAGSLLAAGPFESPLPSLVPFRRTLFYRSNSIL